MTSVYSMLGLFSMSVWPIDYYWTHLCTKVGFTVIWEGQCCVYLYPERTNVFIALTLIIQDLFALKLIKLLKDFDGVKTKTYYTIILES